MSSREVRALRVVGCGGKGGPSGSNICRRDVRYWGWALGLFLVWVSEWELRVPVVDRCVLVSLSVAGVVARRFFPTG